MAPTAGTRLRFKNARSKKVQHVKKLPSLKNRIRGLERFLSRGGIADATRRAKKAELQQLKEEYEKKDQAAVEKQNAEKCKRPRFFERVKVMRKLRQTKKCIEQVQSHFCIVISAVRKKL
uniref:rRNA-processing protein EFG1 n=1 Tax=Peronospora matthiolae TaxID=2874970 RepID=A0AAV1U7J2_9STRA